MSELALKLIKEAKEKRLTRLDLGNCGLTELSNEIIERIAEISNLKKLELTSNSTNVGEENLIHSIPKKIEILRTLKTLQIGSFSSKSKITDLNPIRNLKNLEFLSITNCEIEDITPIKDLKSLFYVDFQSNKIKDISALSSLNKLTTISLNNNVIQDLSPLSYIQDLRSLYVSRNLIERIPYFQNLKELNIGQNPIDFTFLSNYTALNGLYIPNSNIEDISFLKYMIFLKSLGLNNNKIEDIRIISNFKQIVNLTLSSNCIKDISPLSCISTLGPTYIDENKVEDISCLNDFEIFKKTPINAFISLNNNNIRSLKPIRNLLYSVPFNWKEDRVIDDNQEFYYGVYIKNNPLIDPPKYIVEQGNAAILSYWQELENKKPITNNQTKLIFVGNSRAGKTSLWQFLRDKTYNDKADSTHGIKTEVWDSEPLETEDNQNLAAHIWDFGGQEYYHATHRLFLADNAVYVLVWEKDNNKQGTRLEKFKLDDDPNGEIEEVELEHFPASYWLENIAYFAGKHCPVLIVQNKVDEEAQKANYTEGVSETSDCFHLSVQNAFGFQEGNLTLKRHDLRFQDFKERLLELLRKNATSFPVLEYYREVRKRLKELAQQHEYLTIEYLEKIAFKEDKTKTPDMQNLLLYLKNFTNTILYFPQNDLLKDRLYLNPTHISRDIYKILNKTVRDNNGKFDVVHIQKRLNYDALDAERFVALMTEFDLIFEKSKTKAGENLRQFVTPQYLPKYEDLDDTVHFLIEGYEFKTSFFIKFKSFVPRSMMLRFIAQNGAYANQETYWRNGIIYKSSFSQKMIKVEYDHEQLTFSIFVQEKDTQKIDMQNIVAQFVKLNDGDDKIEISNEGNTYFELRKIYMAYDQKRKEIDNNEGQYSPLSNFDWLFEKHKMKEDNFISSNIESQPTHSSANLKILMLTANPTNKRKLELSKEQGDIDYKLQDKRDKLQLTTKRSVNISEFKEFIEKNKPNILHFSGHGEGVDSEAGIVVHNDDKNADELITLDGLDALFEYLTTDCHIKLDAVVLNACFSEEQAKVISKYVPIVMGTSVSIGDTLAIAFSTGFYFKLAESEQVDYELAFKSGRTQAVLKGASRANFVLFKNGSKVEF